MLQYPDQGDSVGVFHYDDYRRLHYEFLHSYKTLYENVGGFVTLPEKFIKQAEPVIEKYLQKDFQLLYSADKKLRVQVITDFINRFYEFIDEVTEMFIVHQSLSEQALEYLDRVSVLNRKSDNRVVGYEEPYVKLIPELQNLLKTLRLAKEKADLTLVQLDSLKPVWEKIKGLVEE